MPTWLLIVGPIILIATFIVFPVSYEYYYEWKEKKNANSGTGKKDD
jgi:hypothetical protein